jgi:hypothetical protein
MAERVMLVEVQPSMPSAPIDATWNPLDKEAAVTLSNENLTATKSVHASSWGCVRSTVSVRSGQWYWETTYDLVGATSNIATGVATSGHSLFDMPGQFAGIATAVGGPDRSGQCRLNGVVTASFGAIASGSVVRHWLDLDGMTYKIAINGGAWVEVQSNGSFNGIEYLLSTGSGIFPVVGLLRPAGTNATCVANFGQNAFAYPVPPGANPGVYIPQAPEPVSLYLSSHAIGTGVGETPESQQYDPCILTDQDVRNVREAGCWVWGTSTQSKIGRIVVTNVDGSRDIWSDYNWRDAKITIYSGYLGQPRSSFTVWAGTRVNDLTFDDHRIAINLSDPLSILDAPIQTEVYPITHPIEAEIGNPIPITFGLPFYVTGVRMSPLKIGVDAYAWQAHDGLAPLLTGLGTIFDNGIDITANCVQWPAGLVPKKGFRVSGTAPFGKVTYHPVGNGSTTVLTIVQQAMARLPADRMAAMPIVQQAGGVAGIGYWAAMFIKQPRTILEVIRESMDSVCGWACPSRDGTQLRLGAVREPSGEASVLELNETNIIGFPKIRLDQAKGLTTRLKGRRNYSPHSLSDIATSIKDPASPTYDPNLLANLMADYMATRTGVPQQINESIVSSAYAQARQAQARATLLQEPTHIQRQANRACTLWYPTRHFVDVRSSILAAQADALEPGDIVTLRWPRYGLNNPNAARASMQFLVVLVDTGFWGGYSDLVLWGSLPITIFAEGLKLGGDEKIAPETMALARDLYLSEAAA